MSTSEIAIQGTSITLGEIATLVGGQLIGDPGQVCLGAGVPDEAAAGEITMIDHAKRADSISNCLASAVITPEKVDIARSQIVVSDVHEAFATVIKHFRPLSSTAMPASGVDATAVIASTAFVHPTAVIGPHVTIGERTCIMPGAVVMPGATIGEDCVLHASVTIYEHTRIEDRVIIHAGSVIGANGFGYRFDNGRHVPTSQLGFVAIESDVEIGAAVTIDRGTYGSTRIGQGTKIDNQVMIAHNCQIGKHNLICSQVGIAGSCKTGDYVILAGQVGLKDHVTLGDRAIVGAQAGVMDNLEGDNVYLGSPATTQREQMQIMAVERRLPEMRRELKRLRKEVTDLQQEVDTADRRAA
ncbi:UDP-3-O-acylglucosamine N-acyltransferase [Rubripirellula amarantea]|uniref:UDP-3-O-acylglucosamine N-acyltransferase n=1 Tax=Rubripirellula amarantea TaxID=2527999 RepID=A0A5C5WGL5_9BACT|nr:UDP-3-O-(3-hydroxymyristoyl)glucosamine N-acyltransferase [Rubripirellula amarantea]TWT49251.1 UDP-3-O-acylglucosamine N-acyltransferase [Rubripirellula amarantea]